MIDCDMIDVEDRLADGETEGPWGMSIEERRELVDEILDLRVKHDDIARQILVEQDPCERLKLDVDLKEIREEMDEKYTVYYADDIRHADDVIRDAEDLLARI